LSPTLLLKGSCLGSKVKLNVLTKKEKKMKRLYAAHKQLMIPFAIAIMIAVFALSAPNASCQKRHHGAAAATQATHTPVDPCRINAESTTCLKSRIDRLGAALTNLEERVNQLQRTSQSSGDDKGDSSSAIWKEINRIKERLNMK
jgi:hypothetical protein